MRYYTSVWILWDEQDACIARVRKRSYSGKCFGVFLRKCDFSNSTAAKMVTDNPKRYTLKEIECSTF
jgi:hypothetical protein